MAYVSAFALSAAVFPICPVWDGDYDDHWRERGEYMYTVFKELKYNKTVTYRINEIDYGEYTTRNNYEKYNIIHLVHKTERDGNYIAI